MRKKRIEWIDYVRCISMVMIIVCHTYAPSFLRNFLFAVNVPVFFVLSGYLTREKKITETMKNGFFTLLIPYIVTVLIMFLISLISLQRHVKGMITTDNWYHYIIAGLYGIGAPTNQSIIPNANIPAIGAIWFLLAMYFGNVIYQIVLRFSNRFSSNISSVILIFFSVVFAISGFTISHFVQLPWSIGAAFISIAFYVAGHLIRKYDFMNINNQNLLFSLFGLLLWTIATIEGPFGVVDGIAAHPFIAMLGAIGGSYFLMYFIKTLSLYVNIPLLAKLGRLALITLSIHIIFLNLFSDTVFLSRKMLEYHLLPEIIGILLDIYRVVFCWILTLILSKFKLVNKLFAIR